MKIGNKTIRDRRGSVQRILDHVRENGTMPRYANWRTIRRLVEVGEISFHGGRYHLGLKPARQRGYYWVKDDGWLVAEWNGTAWYVVNGQRPFADTEFTIIGEKIERSRVLQDFEVAIGANLNHEWEA